MCLKYFCISIWKSMNLFMSHVHVDILFLDNSFLSVLSKRGKLASVDFWRKLFQMIFVIEWS